MSVYDPNPVPPDPTADRGLTTRITSLNDLRIKDSKGDGQIKAMFDQGSFRNFNLEITPGNVALMKQDPSLELKVHCRVTVDYNTPEAKTFAGFGLGCGYKGSVGSLRMCLDEYHHENGECRKLSLRVDTNSFKLLNTTNPAIYGLRKLIFNGMPVDWSMMSERTSYNLLGALGVVAPMASHAKVFLNGKYLGVYSFVQDVDAEFTKSRFDKDKNKGKGTLYKDLWFNRVHMAELGQPPKKDDGFMREIMNTIEATPATLPAAKAFFDKYFDTDSLVDSTAFNTVIGNSDDWRQRHNFFWYVKQEKSKKLVFIPWDYDRLYDEMADTRGALKGTPWWKIKETTGPGVCTKPLNSPETQAALMGGSAAMIAYNTGIWAQYPKDLDIPVTCDKLTQLMAVALGPLIRSRTIELTRRISIPKVKQNWATWNAQIQAAVLADPDGPTLFKMQEEQTKLEESIKRFFSKAISDANSETTGTSSTSASPAKPAPGPPSFAAPASFAASASFASASFAPASFASSFPASSLPTSFGSPTFTSFSQPFGAAPMFSTGIGG